jgi:hypothetical protein
MPNPNVNGHRLLTATIAVVALIGWGAYAYSVCSAATRDQEQLESLARMATDRDALVSEQQRLQRELALANAQLAAARDEIASLELQPKVAKKGDLGAVEPVDPPPGATASSELARLIASRDRDAGAGTAAARPRPGARPARAR